MHLFFKYLLLAAPLVSTALADETVDWIIRAKYIVTMDEQHRIIPQGAIALRGAYIIGVGSQAEIAKRFLPHHTLDKPDALIAPGLIDTHTHAPMSLFRAIADDKRLQDWLNNYIFPAESRNVSPEFVRWGTRLACLEMVLAGITTYTDMYYFEDVEAETAREAGLRGVLGQTIIGFPVPDAKTWKDSLAKTEQYIQKFKHDELITPTVAPHAIYTTPDEALVEAHKLSIKYDVPYLIHLSETEKEVQDSVAARHLTPTQLLKQLGGLDGRVVAAHGVWEDDEGIRILKQHGTGVAHCPSSNMKLASGVAPVVKM